MEYYSLNKKYPQTGSKLYEETSRLTQKFLDQLGVELHPKDFLAVYPCLDCGDNKKVSILIGTRKDPADNAAGNIALNPERLNLGAKFGFLKLVFSQSDYSEVVLMLVDPASKPGIESRYIQ